MSWATGNVSPAGMTEWYGGLGGKGKIGICKRMRPRPRVPVLELPGGRAVSISSRQDRSDGTIMREALPGLDLRRTARIETRRKSIAKC